MLKAISELLSSDTRFTSMVGGLNEDGTARMMSITDLHALVEPLQLDSAVPGDIHEQFDKARHAFIYSWFAYDMVSLAEQQGYQTLELALREKLQPADREKADARRWGLAKLLNHAVVCGWLTRAEFEVEPQNPLDPAICSLDVVAMFRNELAHGSRNLIPNGSLVMLQLCADILNRLFLSKK